MQRYFGAAVGKGRQVAKTYTPFPLITQFCSYVINKQILSWWSTTTEALYLNKTN